MAAPAATTPLVTSPRLIVGRIRAVNAADGLAFVELALDAPGEAMMEGAQLAARTMDLRVTAKLQASRYVRGRTLGARIVSGQPTPGDEVVWQVAPPGP